MLPTIPFTRRACISVGVLRPRSIALIPTRDDRDAAFALASGLAERTLAIPAESPEQDAAALADGVPRFAKGAHSMLSTVRRRDRPHRLPSFVAIAGVAVCLLPP